MSNAFVIKIKKEDLPKVRKQHAPPVQRHRSPKDYKRKPKHPRKEDS